MSERNKQVKYFQRKNWEKFCISKQPCNVLFIIIKKKNQDSTWLRSATVIVSSSLHGRRGTNASLWYLALMKVALVGLEIEE